VQRRLVLFITMLLATAVGTLCGLATGTTNAAAARSTYDVPAVARTYVQSPTIDGSTRHQPTLSGRWSVSPLTSAHGTSTTSSLSFVATNTARLAQDVAVSPTAPRALGLNRSIGRASHNQALQSDIAGLPRGAM
jgi:hypothetical protein